MEFQSGTCRYYLRNSSLSCCLDAKVLDSHAHRLWHTNCPVSGEVKRWLNIALLIGVITILSVPYDPNPEALPAASGVVVLERAAYFGRSVDRIAAESRNFPPSGHSFAEAKPYSPRSCSIIDVTCARLC